MRINSLKTWLLIFCLLLTGSTCTLVQNKTDNPPSTDQGWQTLSPAWQRRVFLTQSGQKSIQYIVYKFPRDSVQADLRHDKQPLRLEEWQTKEHADLVVNGSYFTDAYEPTGYTTIHGKPINEHVYQSDSAGFLVIQNGKLSLDLASTPPNLDEQTSVVQSFPNLIKDGKPSLTEDSQQLARRTIVAEDSEGFISLILFDRTPVSLFEAMQVLLSNGEHYINALNLDGGTSTGLSAHIKDFHEEILPLSPLPQVIVFSEIQPD